LRFNIKGVPSLDEFTPDNNYTEKKTKNYKNLLCETTGILKAGTFGILEGILKLHTMPSLFAKEKGIISSLYDIEDNHMAMYLLSGFTSATWTLTSYLSAAQEHPEYLLAPLVTNFFSLMKVANE